MKNVFTGLCNSRLDWPDLILAFAASGDFTWMQIYLEERIISVYPFWIQVYMRARGKTIAHLFLDDG